MDCTIKDGAFNKKSFISAYFLKYSECMPLGKNQKFGNETDRLEQFGVQQPANQYRCQQFSQANGNYHYSFGVCSRLRDHLPTENDRK